MGVEDRKLGCLRRSQGACVAWGSGGGGSRLSCSSLHLRFEGGGWGLSLGPLENENESPTEDMVSVNSSFPKEVVLGDPGLTSRLADLPWAPVSVLEACIGDMSSSP